MSQPRPPAQIKPRRVSFDWEPTPLAWIPGEPVAAHIIDVLHLLLPAGERWFVHVYKQVMPLIEDERLKADVKGFMGQEAVHSRAHAAVLDHLRANGLNPDPFTRRVDWLFTKLLGDRSMRLIPRKRWLLERVAIIAAIEHYTAVLGAWILDSPALDAAGADPTMLDLLRWHGAEEVEHRSVAFDVFRAVHNSWFSRLRTMIVSAAAMAYLWRRGMRYLCRADPTYHGPLPTFRDFRRAAKKGLLPMPSLLVLAVPRYCKASYHPSQEADTQTALSYLAASPAATAAAA
ncbi:MAG TPA: metal-dependent hydrolase [Mycobacteriales bacterium]|nr:metal-dependent hydrolase [Mycobacteriales bacterium]